MSEADWVARYFSELEKRKAAEDALSEAQAKLDAYIDGAKMWDELARERWDEIVRLAVRLEALEGALRWYADKTNWNGEHTNAGWHHVDRKPRTELDRGDRARAALTQEEQT